MSRPSSVTPIFQNLARGETFAERLVIPLDVFRVGEYAGRTDDVAEKLERRRHPIRRREMIDQFGGDPWILQVLPDQPRVLFVNRLTGSGLCAHSSDRKEQQRDEDESAWHRAIVVVALCRRLRRDSTGRHRPRLTAAATK